MLGRRELFKRLAGAGIAAATVKPADLMAASEKAALGEGLGEIPSVFDAADPPTNCTRDDDSYQMWRMLDDAEEQMHLDRSEVRHMDPSIRDKKSWSPAYKSIMHTQEGKMMLDVRKRMQRGTEFRTKVLGMLKGAMK